MARIYRSNPVNEDLLTFSWGSLVPHEPFAFNYETCASSLGLFSCFSRFSYGVPYIL